MRDRTDTADCIADCMAAHTVADCTSADTVAGCTSADTAVGRTDYMPVDSAVAAPTAEDSCFVCP